MPIILATLEAEIRRIVVQCQLWNPILKLTTQKEASGMAEVSGRVPA
jgi:hypothetical protein